MGEIVSWSTSIWGGAGSSAVSWSGTDGLSGAGRSLSWTYGAPGIKTAAVIIVSGSESITRHCENSVNIASSPFVQPLFASCSPNVASVNVRGGVTWQAFVSGGSGFYNYFWSGTDGLSGGTANVFTTYQTPGVKIGTVTVASGGQSTSATCSPSVAVNDFTPTLAVNCQPAPAAISPNQTLTWIASVSGGSGFHNYFWSGTDGLSGSGSSVVKHYTSPGVKLATVTVTSGVQSASQTCSAVVAGAEVSALKVNCFADAANIRIGRPVSWVALISGGSGAYIYSWTGTDSFFGASRVVPKIYTSPGRKFATVSVTSGAESSSAVCTNSVLVSRPVPPPPPRRPLPPPPAAALDGSCAADVTNVKVGEAVVWSARASGGTGAYTYSWSGSDGLIGDQNAVSKVYSEDGSKTALVNITSGGGTISRPCSNAVFVERDKASAAAFSIFSPLGIIILLIMLLLLAIVTLLFRRAVASKI